MIEESRIPTIGDRSSAISNDGMDGTTAGQINALTDKATVVDADVTLIEDSAAGYAKKKSTFGTIKEWIMDWVATFIVAGTGISTSYNDAGDALTINATGISATDEVIQDSIGGILGASLIYDDATPRIERAALTGAITAAQNSNATSLGSFTKAQLDAAVSDGNVLYVGDLTQYTDEMAQDAIGLMIDSTLVYVDATPLLQRAAITGHVTIAAGSNSALLGSFTKAQLDAAVSDGNVLYVGDVTQYTDEMAQDAIGAMIDTTLVYTDATPLLQRAALTGAITANLGSNATSLGSFTKAQLDAAVSDGDVSYVGSNVTSLDGQQGTQTLGGILNGLTAKTTPADADMTVLMDSAAANASKKLSWSDIKTAIKTYYDAVTSTLTNKTINLTNNTLSGTKAQFNTAVSDGDIMYLDSTDTVTGVKTFNSSALRLMGATSGQATLNAPAVASTYVYTLPAATVTLIGTSDTATVTNKSFSLTNNTLTGTKAEFNTAVTDGNIVFLDSVDTITGQKTMTDPLLTVTTPSTNSIGYLGTPVNSQSAAYTLVMSDAGKTILHPSTDANARTFTIPANSSVAYPIGTILSFINETSQVLSIAITTDTMTLVNTVTTGTRSLAQNGMATAVKITSTKWIISGVGLT